MKCKVGDLAVVIRAQCRCNLGRIVLIVAADDGTDFVSFKNEGPVWRVKSESPQTWYVGGKRYRRKIGPVPENRLQPIRGTPKTDRRQLVEVRGQTQGRRNPVSA